VAAAATSAGIKIETKTFPAFTARARPPQDMDNAVFGTLERLEKGQVSDMVLSADKGLFVYAVDKKLPDLSESNPRFAEARSQFGGFMSRMGAQGYISELVEKELKKSEPKPQ